MTSPPEFTLERAVEVARSAHAGQVDKAGLPYIEHPLRVMDRLTSEAERMASVLHDVLEDTDVTAADLLVEGCPTEVVAAVEALTRRDGEAQDAALQRARSNPIARAVKLADVADNSDEARLALLDPKEAARLRTKYRHATRVLASDPGAGVNLLRDPEAPRPEGVSFTCATCGTAAASVAIEAAGSALGLAIDGFLGSGWLEIRDEQAVEVGRALAAGDAGLLGATSPAFAPFHCTACRADYCADHWQPISVNFADDHPGWYEDTTGVCPEGHTRRLDD